MTASPCHYLDKQNRAFLKVLFPGKFIGIHCDTQRRTNPTSPSPIEYQCDWLKNHSLGSPELQVGNDDKSYLRTEKSRL